MKLIDKVRYLHRREISSEEDVTKVAECLGKVFNCDTFIMDEKGVLLGVFNMQPIQCPVIKEMLELGAVSVVNMIQIDALTEGVENSFCLDQVCVEEEQKKCIYRNDYVYEVPSIIHGQRMGTAIFWRKKKRFSEEEKTILEMIVAAMGRERFFYKEIQAMIETEKKKKITKFLSSLSPMEKKAMEAILIELDGAKEKQMVTCRIADSAGITRSVVLNTLKKLVGAGVGEFIAMGQLGTYVKILEDISVEDIRKV